MRYAPFIFLALFLVAASSAQQRTLDDGVLPSVWAANMLVPEAVVGSNPAWAGVSGPDTTTHWRYYPLEIGNAWEYKEFSTGIRYRNVVDRDTVIAGREYFIVQQVQWQPGGSAEMIGVRRIRYDSTSALVMEPLPPPDNERVPAWAPCPFDADFDSIVNCPGFGNLPYDVTGSYGAALVFGGEEPGTGTDTIRTSLKIYDLADVVTDILRYAAGFGEAYRDSKVSTYGLYFARIAGIEYGASLNPVGIEETDPILSSEHALDIRPNPASNAIQFNIPYCERSAAPVDVLDVLGRRVFSGSFSASATNGSVGTFSVDQLSPGTHFLRVSCQSGSFAPLVGVFTVVR